MLASGPNIKIWTTKHKVYIGGEFKGWFTKIKKLDKETEYFSVHWLDHPNDAGKIMTFHRANIGTGTLEDWARNPSRGFPADEVF